jgi:hypothetical protein
VAMLQRQETPNNSAEQVREYVEKAIALLDELGVQGDDRAALLPTVVELYSGKQIIMMQAPHVDLGVLSAGLPRI